MQVLETLGSCSAPHFKKWQCNVYFVKKKQQNHSSTMVVTQSRNILISLFVRVVFDLVVLLSLQTVCTKVSVVQEVVSQLYSNVMGLNPILR